MHQLVCGCHDMPRCAHAWDAMKCLSAPSWLVGMLCKPRICKGNALQLWYMLCQLQVSMACQQLCDTPWSARYHFCAIEQHPVGRIWWLLACQHQCLHLQHGASKGQALLCCLPTFVLWLVLFAVASSVWRVALRPSKPSRAPSASAQSSDSCCLLDWLSDCRAAASALPCIPPPGVCCKWQTPLTTIIGIGVVTHDAGLVTQGWVQDLCAPAEVPQPLHNQLYYNAMHFDIAHGRLNSVCRLVLCITCDATPISRQTIMHMCWEA